MYAFCEWHGIYDFSIGCGCPPEEGRIYRTRDIKERAQIDLQLHIVNTLMEMAFDLTQIRKEIETIRLRK